jgi:hypothetical protein
MGGSRVGGRSLEKSPIPTFTVTAIAHLGVTLHRGMNDVLAALPGARFDETGVTLTYSEAVGAVDASEATRLTRERVLHALRKAGVFAVPSELQIWVTELEH